MIRGRAERVVISRKGEVFLVFDTKQKLPLHLESNFSELLQKLRMAPRSWSIVRSDHPDALLTGDGSMYDIPSLLEGLLVEA